MRDAIQADGFDMKKLDNTIEYVSYNEAIDLYYDLGEYMEDN